VWAQAQLMQVVRLSHELANMTQYAQTATWQMTSASNDKLAALMATFAKVCWCWCPLNVP
jgi:hypothetical protein